MNWSTPFEYHKNIASIWSKWHSDERFEKWSASFFKRAGFEVLESGWPDLLVVTPQGRICAIEVKQGYDTVKPNQRRVHELLRQAGISTIVLRSNPSMPRFLQENGTREKKSMFSAQHKRTHDSHGELLYSYLRVIDEDFEGLGVS